MRRLLSLTRPKTEDAQIVQVALGLVERLGRDGFTMNDVAGAVGIRAPSLYGRFEDRDSLLAAVAQAIRRFVGGLPRLGFGLWRIPQVSLVAELALVLIGAWLYWRAASRVANDQQGRRFWKAGPSGPATLCPAMAERILVSYQASEHRRSSCPQRWSK